MPQTNTNNTPSPLQFDAKDIADNKGMAALSYVSFLVFIPLLTKKDSRFAQAHAKQGLVMLIVSVILAIIPWIGWIADILLLVVDLVALINALQGKFWQIPGVYDLSKKLNI